MGLQDSLASRTPDASAESSRNAREERNRRRYQGPVTPATAQIAGLEELEKATARLAEFEGSLPARRLDARRIRFSAFANRHPDHFQSPAFARLREDIGSAGGNVQPIRVRRVTGDPAADYEVIYGHRRLQACRELELAVEAVIVDIDDNAMFEAMTRENNAREDLSPYEEGMSYRAALERELYPSQHKLAAAVGVTQARVSQVLSIASLPPEVIAAFPSALAIQSRWADALHRRLKEDRESVLKQAVTLAADPSRTARDVFEKLTGRAAQSSVDVVVRGKRRAVVRVKLGVVTVSFAKGVLPPARINELAAELERWLEGQGTEPAPSKRGTTKSARDPTRK